MPLNRKEWSWIIFIPLLATVVTMGAFIIYLPTYVVAMVIAYYTAGCLPKLFNKSQYPFYVIKVSTFSVLLFFAIIVIQNYFTGLYFKQQWGI